MTTIERTRLVGSTTPRLWTPPLAVGPPGGCTCGCALTPATSAGFSAIAFATEVIGIELLPYQRWLLIHVLELRPGGRYRFRTVVILIARQCGKTCLLRIIALWTLYLRQRCLVLGSAQDLKIAREAWQGAVELAETVDELRAEIAPNGPPGQRRAVPDAGQRRPLHDHGHDPLRRARAVGRPACCWTSSASIAAGSPGAR